ncbi:MAG: hypothetical protein LBP26_04755 [Clostridiales bacterium]|jgi:hypothetical protein|nr:hypothetical protein [Clostridiales bacterium]
MIVAVVTVIIVLSVVGLRVRGSVEGHADMIENDGFFVVRIYGVRVFRGDIRFESNDIKHNNLIIEHGKKHKRDEIHLNADRGDRRSVVRLMSNPVFDNLIVEELAFDVRVGKNNDAFFTTMVLGTLRIMLYSALAFVKSRFYADIAETFTPEYNSDRFESDFFGIISLSIADIIYSYVRAAFKKLRRRKERRQTARKEAGG